jgi:IS30 family transposase
MTYDNGMEMANHKWLTDKTGIDIYFASSIFFLGTRNQRKHKWTYQTLFPKELTLINKKQIREAEYKLKIDPGRYLDTKLHIK